MLSFPLSKATLALAASAVVALAACAAARADEPSPAAIGYANVIFADIGMKANIDAIVPAMLAELERRVTATRPDLKAPLDEVLKTIEPEFVKGEDKVLNDTARVLATQMTEQELKDTAAFYETPTGKKFVAVQLVVFRTVTDLALAWRERLATDMLVRAREEMAKKGLSF
jgi:hypothetical protein